MSATTTAGGFNQEFNPHIFCRENHQVCQVGERPPWKITANTSLEDRPFHPIGKDEISNHPPFRGLCLLSYSAWFYGKVVLKKKPWLLLFCLYLLNIRNTNGAFSHQRLQKNDMCGKQRNTLPETKIAPENRPCQKESSLPTIKLQVRRS